MSSWLVRNNRSAGHEVTRPLGRVAETMTSAPPQQLSGKRFMGGLRRHEMKRYCSNSMIDNQSGGYLSLAIIIQVVDADRTRASMTKS